MKIDCGHYPLMGGFDELLQAPGKPRSGAGELCDFFAGLAPEELEARHRAVDAAIMAAGITFTVYSEAGNIDRTWPFDVVPRIIEKTEWDRIEAGLKQRLAALNRFIDDIYHDRNIIRDGVFPAEVLADSKNFRAACVGPKSTPDERARFAELIRANPRNYMAQPTLSTWARPTSWCAK